MAASRSFLRREDSLLMCTLFVSGPIFEGSVHKPILYMIDRVSDRRSFCTRVVKAIQEGQAIFTCQVSFHKVITFAMIFFFFVISQLFNLQFWKFFCTSQIA